MTFCRMTFRCNGPDAALAGQKAERQNTEMANAMIAASAASTTMMAQLAVVFLFCVAMLGSGL